MKLTIGTDPEFFLYKDGLPIPAIGLLGGTKGEPRPLGRGVGIQEDNVMGEFTFEPVSLSDPAKLFDNVQWALEEIKKLTGADPLFEASALFKPKQLDSAKAREFGCSLDWNIYEKENHRSVPEMPANTRFAGGHVHFGAEFLKSRKLARRFTRILDLFIAMPAINRDKNNLRRKAYGKPGNLRYKSYGMEYRTPSNWWLASEEELRWLFGQIDASLKFYDKKTRIEPQDQALIFNSVQQSQYEPKIIQKYGVSF